MSSEGFIRAVCLIAFVTFRAAWNMRLATLNLLD